MERLFKVGRIAEKGGIKPEFGIIPQPLASSFHYVKTEDWELLTFDGNWEFSPVALLLIPDGQEQPN